MVTNASAELTIRLITERHAELVKCIDQMQTVFSDNNNEAKVKLANQALDKVTTLRESLSSQDRPPWLEPLASSLDRYCKRPADGNTRTHVMTTIAQAWTPLHNYAVKFVDDSSVKPFDFDGVYDKYFKQSKLPQLFDELVEQLDKIIASNELDSRKIAHALTLLAATLKKNRNGSFFSLICTWDFTRSYTKNVLWEAIDECPGLKVFTKALRKTMEEMDTEMQTLHKNVKEDLHTQMSDRGHSIPAFGSD